MEIVSGLSSRRKTVRVRGLTAAQAQDRLRRKDLNEAVGSWWR